MLSQFSKRKGLPDTLEARIKKFIENNHQESLFEMDYESLINDLPAVLKQRIIHFTHKDIIAKIEFLKDKDQEFI
jgi:hypothetical protein